MNIQAYFAEIQKIRLLQLDEERALWNEYKNYQNEDARQSLIIHYQPLVVKALSTWQLPTPWLLDTLQEGMIGLMEAVELYDPSRGVAFSLYGLHRIRGRMVDFMKKEGRNPTFSVDSPWGEGGTWADQLASSETPVAESAENRWLSEVVQSLMLRLPEKEQAVLSGVYIQERSAKQLADELQVSLGYVYRLQERGVRRIRGMVARWIGEWNGKEEKKSRKTAKKRQ